MANILIVDDEKIVRKVLSDIFNGWGHKVVGEGENAKEALELYKILKPDIVTLDILMPNVEGVDTIRAIKEIVDMDKEAKIIIVSAIRQAEMVAECMQAGARDYIAKPFDISDLIDAVDRLLEKRPAPVVREASQAELCYGFENQGNSLR